MDAGGESTVQYRTPRAMLAPSPNAPPNTKCQPFATLLLTTYYCPRLMPQSNTLPHFRHDAFFSPTNAAQADALSSFRYNLCCSQGDAGRIRAVTNRAIDRPSPRKYHTRTAPRSIITTSRPGSLVLWRNYQRGPACPSLMLSHAPRSMPITVATASRSPLFLQGGSRARRRAGKAATIPLTVHLLFLRRDSAVSPTLPSHPGFSRDRVY